MITKLNDSVVTALHWKTQRKVKVNLDRVYTGRINKRMKLLQKSQLGIGINNQVEKESSTNERDISETDETLKNQINDSMREDSESDQIDCLFGFF